MIRDIFLSIKVVVVFLIKTDSIESFLLLIVWNSDIAPSNDRGRVHASGRNRGHVLECSVLLAFGSFLERTRA